MFSVSCLKTQNMLASSSQIHVLQIFFRQPMSWKTPQRCFGFSETISAKKCKVCRRRVHLFSEKGNTKLYFNGIFKSVRTSLGLSRASFFYPILEVDSHQLTWIPKEPGISTEISYNRKALRLWIPHKPLRLRLNLLAVLNTRLNPTDVKHIIFSLRFKKGFGNMQL